MHYRYFKAVASCALAIACASATTVVNAAQWTSFPVGNLGPSGYGLSMARLSDGRFVLGAQGSLYVQNAWGSGAKTQISSNNIVHDPSFVAIRSDTSGLLGAGGFAGASGLFGFNPSSTATPLVSTALATLQNYSGVYWKHPNSGREGWIIGGTNGAAGKHNLTFVSNDGAKVGAITGVISTYSSGVCTDAQGNLYASLSEFGTADAADTDKVLKFTAAQIDAAVAGVISGTPALLAKADAALVHQFAGGAASISVDSAGRVWAAAYAGYMEVYDPVSGFTRSITPDHGPLKNAAGTVTAGAIAYQVQTFSHAGQNFVGFFASDLYGSNGVSMVQGYKLVSEISTRAVYFPSTSITKNEADGTVTITAEISPAPTAKVTVPFTVSGSAVKGRDYSVPSTSLTFDATHPTASISVNIIDNPVDADVDAKTVVLRLGDPTPSTEAFTLSSANTFTLTIMDDDHKPVIADAQSFTDGRIGTDYNYQVALASGTATLYKASGLPPGMKIDPLTGVISGRPTEPGEYDEIWITAINAAGTATSKGYYFKVDDFAASAHGGFVGLVDRSGPATDGLGARFELTVADAATFTGRVIIGSNPYGFSGLLDTSTTNPTGAASFTRNKVLYNVIFSINASTGAVGGTIGTAAITGWCAKKSTPVSGNHNFFAATPGGPGINDPHGATYGCVSVLPNGSASVTVRAADGTVFASTAPIGPNGEVLVYQTAYTLKGSMMGQLTIASDVPHTMGGTIGWTRPVQPSGGWAGEIQLTAKGGKYRPVSGSAIVMSLPAKVGANGDLLVQDGGVLTPVHVPFGVTSPAVVTIGAGNKLAFTNSTGAFTGSYNFGGVNLMFQGMIVPNLTTSDLYDGTGVGYFLTPGSDSVVIRSGMVMLTAAP